MGWHRLVLLATVSGGCNQVFGLQPTEARDASYFDAPIDAPYACPTMLGTAPQFHVEYHQVIRENCTMYTISPATNTALALCTAMGKVYSGPIDQPLTQAAGFMPLASYFSGVDIAPEGDIAIAQQYDQTTQTNRISVYRNVGGTWNTDVDIRTAMNQADSTGAPSRGPQRHLLIAEHEDFYIHELVENPPGTWTDVRRTSYADMNVTYLSHPSLTPDGLRMTTYGARPNGTSISDLGVLYADRASTDVPFGKPVMLTGPPPVLDPFMTEDCARVYFTGLQSVFYVNQI